MTGQQGNPFNGVTLQNRESNELNLPVILEAIGVDHVQVVDAFDRDAVRAALKDALGRDELDVIVFRGPCVLLSKTKDKPYYVNVVLLGALAVSLPFDFSLWEEVIRNNVPPKTIDVNLEAFHLGANYMQGE